MRCELGDSVVLPVGEHEARRVGDGDDRAVSSVEMSGGGPVENWPHRLRTVPVADRRVESGVERGSEELISKVRVGRRVIGRSVQLER